MERLGLGVIDPEDQENATEQDPQVRGRPRGEEGKRKRGRERAGGEGGREGGGEEEGLC